MRRRSTTAAARRPVPRATSKEETRRALVDAALELFAEEGLDAPSLDAICERAGYTRGAFYVHFPDRDALLVAVMERVGESFLASVFEHARAAPSPGGADGASATSGLAEAAERFLAALTRGAYPLMAPPSTLGPASDAAPPRRSRARPRAPQVRPHQLLQACARSAEVRERYRALVEASIAHVAELAAADQSIGAIRADLDPRQVGAILLATIIGAQTMAELGIAIDAGALGSTLMTALTKARGPAA